MIIVTVWVLLLIFKYSMQGEGVDRKREGRITLCVCVYRYAHLESVCEGQRLALGVFLNSF